MIDTQHNTDRPPTEPGAALRLLSVDNLRTWFPTQSGIVHAVDGVTFDLRAGEALGIVGESGSGKSVLGRSIMRLLPATAMTAGRVQFGELELSALTSDAARGIWGNQISMVFQNPMTSLNPVMRIGRQITEVMKRHLQLDAGTARLRAIELLRSVGIPEPAKRLRSYPHELSGGMRQRVCIAIAIACRPRLLIADEPTTALDVTIQRQILDVLDALRTQEEMAMILITHDLGVVAGRTDRVLVMYGGKVLESAPTTTLFERPLHPYTMSLLEAIPRVDSRAHHRLASIPGRPVHVIDPKPGCRFAPRCTRAQNRCLAEDPPLLSVDGDAAHLAACFYPVGTPAGDAAEQRNIAEGTTAAGLSVSASGVVEEAG